MNHHYLDLLGMRVRDRVTNAVGVVVSVTFDLYGCVQAIVEPRTEKGKEQDDARYYDCKRLAVDERVQFLRVPDLEISPAHREILGRLVCDVVTGFEGIATSVCFDLAGTVQCAVRPQLNKKGKGKVVASRWVDCHRLTIIGSAVMPSPYFDDDLGAEPGPAAKPTQTSRPMQ